MIFEIKPAIMHGDDNYQKTAIEYLLCSDSVNLPSLELSNRSSVQRFRLVYRIIENRYLSTIRHYL